MEAACERARRSNEARIPADGPVAGRPRPTNRGCRRGDGARAARRLMKILVSWSTGKDSAWMLHVLRQQHPGAAAGLLTTLNEAFDRVAMHAVRRTLLQAQADAVGLPLYPVNIPWPCSNAEYEQRMGAAVKQFVHDGFTHVAFGDLFLEDVRRYREDRLAGTGLQPLFPLWGTDTLTLAAQMIGAGLEAKITCVDQREIGRASCRERG